MTWMHDTSVPLFLPSCPLPYLPSSHSLLNSRSPHPIWAWLFSRFQRFSLQLLPVCYIINVDFYLYSQKSFFIWEDSVCMNMLLKPEKKKEKSWESSSINWWIIVVVVIVVDDNNNNNNHHNHNHHNHNTLHHEGQGFPFKWNGVV